MKKIKYLCLVAGILSVLTGCATVDYERDISSDPEMVWSLFADTSYYGEWGSFFHTGDGISHGSGIYPSGMRTD